ncbi:hypothetical protein PENSPDRAFT_45706 [Peniophora sp. CONT]|nr:hypothetical protein PENSPDRAFT_45706 [Peniophora sp. CONT]
MAATVSLPHLQKLLAHIHYDGMFSNTKARLYRDFLEHLLLSPHTLLDLEYSGSSTFGDNAEDLNYIVTGVKYVWREDPPHGMRFYKSDLEFYSGSLSELPLDQSLTKPFPEPKDKDSTGLTSRAVLCAFPPWKFAEGLRGSLTVHTQLASLTIFSAPLNSWKTRDWATILHTLPNLRTLYLLYTERYERFDSDDEGAEKREHEDETYWPFPAMGSQPTIWEDQAFSGSPADPSAIFVPQLNMLWLSKYREGVRQEDINQPRLLMYLRDALEARAERNARPLSMVRLDIIAQPGKGERSHANANTLRKLVRRRYLVESA